MRMNIRKWAGLLLGTTYVALTIGSCNLQEFADSILGTLGLSGN